MQYGVFKGESGLWYYRHYAAGHIPEGPYDTRAKAMEALLNELGFDVQTEE